MRTLLLLILIGMPVAPALAEDEPPAHLFDDINGNGIPDADEAASSGENEPGGAEITDPGEGDGSVG